MKKVGVVGNRTRYQSGAYVIHILAFAGQVISPLTIDFDGGKSVGNLLDIAGEVGGDSASE